VRELVLSTLKEYANYWRGEHPSRRVLELAASRRLSARTCRTPKMIKEEELVWVYC
jgi:hypothetical protein